LACEKPVPLITIPQRLSSGKNEEESEVRLANLNLLKNCQTEQEMVSNFVLLFIKNKT